MHHLRRSLAILTVGAICALTPLVPAQAAPAVVRSCKPVVNPYPGTRYEGSDLRRIQASGVSCPSARRVARYAHHKALSLPRPPSGIRRFQWHGWAVTGDVRRASDHYTARKDGAVVRWVF